MNLFKFFTWKDIPTSSVTWNIFSVSWFKSSSICVFNSSLASLISGSVCIGLTIGWQENFLIHQVIASCSHGICFNVEKFRSTIRLVINLGACLGALIPPCLVDVLGRRNNFAIAAILDIICWITLTVVINSPIVLIGTAIGGVATGLFVVTATMYIGEVLPAQSRSTCATLVAFFVYMGVLFSRTLSVFVHNRIAPFMMALVTIGFLLSIYHWMVESPYYLYEQGEMEKAKLALKNLRGAGDILDIDSEYKSIELFFDPKRESIHEHPNMLSSAFMVNSKRLWASGILLLLSISQTMGDYALNDYIEKFLHKLSPRYEKNILSLLDALSICLCIFLCRKISRKYLLIVSIVGLAISCLILAIYSIIHDTKFLVFNVYTDEIVSSVIVILYCITYFLGLTPILPLLTGQVFPNRIKTIAIGLCISLMYFGAIINQTVFEFLDALKGTYTASIAFTVIGSFGLFSLFIFLPGTNTTLHEIQNELNDLNVFAS